LFGFPETELAKKEDDIWEALQLINGSIFIYHKGFKEEAPMKDVFKFVPGESTQFARFDTDLIPPVKDSMVRLNRATIAFAWYVDPDSNTVQDLKKIIAEQKG
jgi:hypothetical protein